MKPPSLDLDALLRRLHLPTVRRLYPDLASRAEQDEISYRDFLTTLMAEEVAHRSQTRVQRSVHRARFPFLATIEDFDFTFQSSVRLSLLGSYLGPELLSEGRNLILCGPSGLGKTHLAVAIAYRAIQNGADALFADANHLIAALSVASSQSKLPESLDAYVHPAVLVIDELGYLTYPLDAANVLFQVIHQRHLKRRSVIITTNKPLAAWAAVLHDADLAEAILDRILERGRILELKGTSYRTRHITKPQPPSPPPKVARISGNNRSEFPEPTSPSVNGQSDPPRRIHMPVRHAFRADSCRDRFPVLSREALIARCMCASGFTAWAALASRRLGRLAAKRGGRYW